LARIRHLADAALRSLGQMMDQSAHPHTVLGLAPGADRAAVRAAYRRLARQFHPDVNRSAGASEWMRELNAAYAVLCDGPTPDVPVPAASAASSYTRGSAVAAAATVASTPHWASAVGAVSSVTFPTLFQSNAITIGIVAGFFGLVALFGVWAFAVARPFGGAAASQVRTAQAPTIQSTTGSLAAQASANAAANAAAARSNLTSGGAAAVPTTSAASSSSAASTSTGSAVVPSAPFANATAAAPATSVQSAAAPNAPAAPELPAAPATALPVVVGALSSQTRSAIPSLPAVPAAQSNPGQNIQAVSAQASQAAPAGDQTTLVQTATRALSNYDKAWTGYASALRFAAAGSLASSATNTTSLRATGAPISAASLLSGDSQLTLARSLYLQQQLAWNPQASAALTAATLSGTTIAQPDAAKAVRGDQRLRQAADLVAQAQSSGAPINAGQVKGLLDEAEQIHRDSIAEWAALLRSLAA
jgi:hypothetical protein